MKFWFFRHLFFVLVKKKTEGLQTSAKCTEFFWILRGVLCNKIQLQIILVWWIPAKLGTLQGFIYHEPSNPMKNTSFGHLKSKPGDLSLKNPLKHVGFGGGFIWGEVANLLWHVIQSHVGPGARQMDGWMEMVISNPFPWDLPNHQIYHFHGNIAIRFGYNDLVGTIQLW